MSITNTYQGDNCLKIIGSNKDTVTEDSNKFLKMNLRSSENYLNNEYDQSIKILYCNLENFLDGSLISLQISAIILIGQVGTEKISDYLDMYEY
jgi:hypothetical protein